MKTNHVFKLAGRAPNGKTGLSPAALEIVRLALTSAWDDAVGAMTAAEAMALPMTLPGAEGQIDYYRNAASFLKGCIARVSPTSPTSRSILKALQQFDPDFHTLSMHPVPDGDSERSADSDPSGVDPEERTGVAGQPDDPLERPPVATAVADGASAGGESPARPARGQRSDVGDAGRPHAGRSRAKHPGGAKRKQTAQPAHTAAKTTKKRTPKTK